LRIGLSDDPHNSAEVSKMKSIRRLFVNAAAGLLLFSLGGCTVIGIGVGAAAGSGTGVGVLGGAVIGGIIGHEIGD
jgi:osmotically inducible lipoprotein OsmB